MWWWWKKTANGHRYAPISLAECQKPITETVSTNFLDQKPGGSDYGFLACHCIERGGTHWEARAVPRSHPERYETIWKWLQAPTIEEVEEAIEISLLSRP